MEPGLRTKLLTAATLALVFASGGITGFATAAGDGDVGEVPERERRAFVFEQFDRSPEQQAQIDSILRSHRKSMSRLNGELEHLRLEYQAASDSISRATGEAIALVFPPEVATEYLERLNQRRADRMRARKEAERESRSRDGN